MSTHSAIMLVHRQVLILGPFRPTLLPSKPLISGRWRRNFVKPVWLSSSCAEITIHSSSRRLLHASAVHAGFWQFDWTLSWLTRVSQLINRLAQVTATGISGDQIAFRFVQICAWLMQSQGICGSFGDSELCIISPLATGFRQIADNFIRIHSEQFASGFARVGQTRIAPNPSLGPYWRRSWPDGM